MAVPKIYYCGVAILGGIVSVVRPHAASGTAKAYRDAITLAYCLHYHKNIDEALPHWNGQQTRVALDLVTYGKRPAIHSGLGLNV